MNSMLKEALPAKFSELNLDERRDLIERLAGDCEALVELVSQERSAAGQGKMRDIAVRLTMTVHVMKLAVDAMKDQYTDNACAMSGLLDILSKLGEKELNSVHLLTLLQPHHEHLLATHEIFDECFAG